MRQLVPISLLVLLLSACGKKSAQPDPPAPLPPPFKNTATAVNDLPPAALYHNIKPVNVKLRFRFNAPVDRNSASGSVTFTNKQGVPQVHFLSYDNGDSTLLVLPSPSLDYLDRYTITVSTALKSSAGNKLVAPASLEFVSTIDSVYKFPLIGDEALLTKVQQQTFKYFWDFAHPVSGLARERSNGDNNLVTSGGSGFGIMALVTGIERGFITRAEGLARMQKIVDFLKNTAQTFHGAYPHWLNGATGAVMPFSANDNGADLVETSYLIQGLLTARQYFGSADPVEATLRSNINLIWERVEWDWFRKTNENQLYWHWSPDKNWVMNLPIKGWNECLITYVLAAASATHGITKAVYDNGWAQNGAMRNNNSYYGYVLPLGPPQGGPLFFSHYSFLGIKPIGLNDAYADYALQTKNHTLINYSYCKANPRGYFGYSDAVWGLTASDTEAGYKASSPTDDNGFIAPTAALSSFPYTPVESMRALKFFYYMLGDKLWKEYGFVDAFSLHSPWFANSFLAIDQGPIIVMIENHRTGLLWNLFTGCPEVKAGMQKLGFSAGYLRTGN